MVARGHDDRTVILVPEVDQNRTVGITLLHVRLAERLPAATLRSVLNDYRNRLAALTDAVTETEPIASLAGRWRQGLLKH